MGSESIYGKKGRVRPPRVHITYDVELNGAQVLSRFRIAFLRAGESGIHLPA